MSQEIKIPVSADTGGAEKSLRDLDKAAEGVAASVSKVAKGTRDASSGVRSMADETRRLAAAQDILSRELGRPISQSDAAIALSNFERIRRGRDTRARGARNFTDFEGWARGYGTMYRTRREAARHRGYMISGVMEGTDDAASHGGMPPEPPEGGGGGEFGRGVGGIRSRAMSFGRSMLALAGIGGVMSMAHRSIDLATEEAVGTDTLKRRLGDVGVEFDRLRDQARAAGEGLGVTYVESQRLARAYSNEVGNLSSTDLRGEGLRGHLRTAYGFGRSYGVDMAESVQFFGQMARYGIGRDEQSQRRLALLIGDSVARSGYGGKVDDLLRAVADYTSMAARMTLTAPNAGAYLNAITSMSATGRPGLDPEAAAGILSAADSAIRRGGAMGEASLNFSYAALRNFSPGLKPVDALALMQGGLFGTTRGIFGPGSPLASYVGRGVHLDDVTNFDKMLPLLRQHYGNGGYLLDAVQNHFGLQSMAQAAALISMSDKGQLGASGRVLQGAGIDPMSLNATGFQLIGRIANGDPRAVFSDLMRRTDITDAQKKVLAAAMATGGGDERVRQALASAVAKLDIAQEKTPGTETRDAITDLTDKLTQAGGPLLSVLNPIRDAVVAIAEMFVPGFLDSSGSHAISRGPGKLGQQGQGMAGIEKDAMAYLMSQGWSRVQAAAILGSDMAESSPNLDPMAYNPKGGGHLGIDQWDKRRWMALKDWARANGLDPRDRMTQVKFQSYELLHGSEAPAGQYLKSAMNSHDAAAAMLRSVRPENWDPLHPEAAALWNERFAQTARLAKVPSAGGGGAGGEHHTIDINVRTPDGKAHKIQKKLPAPVSKPKASGSLTTQEVQAYLSGEHGLFQ